MMTWNPAIRLPEAIALAVIFVIAAVWLAWREAGEMRRVLLPLRTLGLLGIAVRWLNPSRWLDENSSARRDWLVLLDRSASMKSGHDEKATRWETAARLAERLRSESGALGDVKVRPFSTQREDAAPKTSALQPNGTGTALACALADAACPFTRSRSAARGAAAIWY